MPFGFSSITYVTYLRMLFLPQLDCSSTEDRLTQWLQWWDSFLPALCWAEQLSCVCGPVRFGSSRKAAGIFSTPGSMSTYWKWTRTLTLPIALSWDSCDTVDHTSAPRGWLLAIHSAQRGRRNPTTPFFLRGCEGIVDACRWWLKNLCYNDRAANRGCWLEPPGQKCPDEMGAMWVPAGTWGTRNKDIGTWGIHCCSLAVTGCPSINIQCMSGMTHTSTADVGGSDCTPV